MKIGILIADFDALQNYEYRIIQQIIDDSTLELSVLIKDGRESEPMSGFMGKAKRFIKLKRWFALLILKIQILIETKIIKTDTPVADVSRVRRYLESLPVIFLKPESKGYMDYLSVEDADLVRGYNLDLILRHEFRIIQGNILNAAKHGIWSFHHADNSINRGGPPCFWERVLKQPVVGVTLQRLTSELDGGLVIDKGFYNMHWSYYKLKNDVYENSVTLLMKNIKKLQRGEVEYTKSEVYSNPLYRSPSLWYVLKYVSSFYAKILLIFYYRFLSVFGGYRENCWTLFIGKGNFMDKSLYKIKPVKLPANAFWADPFLFPYKEETYVFFENYDYKKKKAGISCGKVVDNKIKDIQDVLNLDYHLSYPFMIEEDGDIYMMPETSNAKRVEIYKCERFPDKWSLYSTAFEGEIVSDTSYYKDAQGQRWLFLTRGEGDLSSELYIYKIDSLKMNIIEPHVQNPVIIDTRIARCGGPIFEQEGQLYRPSQCNIKDIYGYGLNINRIKKLTIEEYEEEKVATVEPNFRKHISATHHLHQIEGMFVFDACYRRYK